jgi:hypothetical protein
MEGVWCGNGWRGHYDYDGLMTGKKSQQSGREIDCVKTNAVMIVFNLYGSVMIGMVAAWKRVVG